MSTQGHESEAINVSGLKASLKKGGNIGIYNEAICSTAGGTAAKVTNTTPPSFTLTAGAKILVKFTYAISAENATLQVGGNSAKPIYYKGSALPADLVKAGTSVLLQYDGTSFNIIGDLNTDTTYSTMGASGSTHASGLVPDTPSAAGTTKFLREDGTWQEPDGKNYSAGDGIDITNNEISVDSTVIYTKTQVDGQFIVIVNSNTEPTESTLTYTSTDGTTKSFKVGDEVRIPDAEADNGYTFYKLYAITTEEGVTTATWDKLGAGGAAPVNPNETVNISLTQVGGNSADLTGASITITDDDSGDTLYTATWAGTMLTTEIDVNTNYTVSVDTITGYLACADQSYQAGYQTERNITFQYRALGAFVEATDGTLYTASTWASSGKTANSVVLITSTMQMRIAITKVDKPIGNNPKGAIENFMTAITDENAAKLDYNGKSNTDKIVQFNISEGTNNTNYAAPYCKAFTFPNGDGNAYLPASGQIWIIYQNKTDINNCLTACNGTTLASYVNTSTYSGQDQLPYRYVWQIRLSTGVFARTNGTGLTTVQEVRPISDYE